MRVSLLGLLLLHLSLLSVFDPPLQRLQLQLLCETTDPMIYASAYRNNERVLVLPTLDQVLSIDGAVSEESR